ncbi:sugar kinase [Glacieibacterium frigidum]|uniref:Sugar kinase n=1 Tax=Glacieibacterium frigidum TaxID=2593303 RepID=A0A552UES2_9SPHN|nr:sugar kinase [Glacieibacterium frigidum]TRW16738.1 sugar kinase [Glacieibacterium frigidum]
MSFVAFGEIMLRMSPPGRELLLQTPKLDVWVAGAEANVVTGLARLGHSTGLIGAVPDNDLGRAGVAGLRAHGVDCSLVRTAAGRMGLYFVTSGAGLRATDVVYDRAGSSFASVPPGEWDWDALLGGADRLHLSGITPALGPGPGEAAIAAAEAASARGLPVSFDGNYRARLWEAWDSDPRGVLGRIVPHADIMFGNHRDIALLLGREFAGDGEDRRSAAAEAAFEAFPKLQIIASTARHVEDADRHRLSARVDGRDGHAQTEEVTIAGIVDRIGAGDAFAVGVLHALRRGGDIAAAAQTGLALTCLKHSLPGDASLFGQADIDTFLEGGLDVRR